MNRSGWTILIPCLSQNHTDTSILRSTAGLDLLSWCKQREVALSDLSPGAVDEELLDLMKLAGFNEVDIGAESTCDSILESLAKDFKREDIIKTANLLKKKKIPITLSL